MPKTVLFRRCCACASIKAGEKLLLRPEYRHASSADRQRRFVRHRICHNYSHAEVENKQRVMVNVWIVLVLLSGCVGAGHHHRHHIQQRGITFTNGKYCPNVTFESPAALTSLQRLAATGASHVAVIVTQYQRFHNSTAIRPLYRPGLVGGDNPAGGKVPLNPRSN